MAVGACQLPGGGGAAWVENARGLLLHLARFDTQGRASLYRIVAPTDWNFHPAGAVALALCGAAATDRDTLAQRITTLVRSLDPCVAWQLEWDDA
jgi:coenzyme F420-reducing hydrogenase alpha subunit